MDVHEKIGQHGLLVGPPIGVALMSRGIQSKALMAIKNKRRDFINVQPRCNILRYTIPCIHGQLSRTTRPPRLAER